MKRTMTALLLALTLVLGLSGCTAKKDNSTNGSTPNNGTMDNGNTNNGTQNGGTNTNDGTVNGGTNNGTARRYGDYYSDSDYAVPGYNGPTSSDSYTDYDRLMRGYSYEDMLRNGRVTDTDGFLTDEENSVTDR